MTVYSVSGKDMKESLSMDTDKEYETTMGCFSLYLLPH